MHEGCSPPERGWTREVEEEGDGGELLPARAGMGPDHGPGRLGRRPAPCPCGDGPNGIRKVWNLVTCSPYARGWTPPLPRADQGSGLLPPAWGGALLAAPAEVRAELLPARAGMARTCPLPSGSWLPAPRLRGDGPVALAFFGGKDSCSPRLRGSPSGVGAEAAF
ncbi:hypothetical protein Shyd_85000 [Streptomyces hydrogenans]|uniref:Uncharacterized protein n=1 Tax=Streptomyces hydrogenans TaxID=1873719 RepID=A0ABQ3PQ42_9ACTN|nr:hypothetical protein GCM10018784_48630 [Streptomyces hydrogenans]GHI27129.1 hypothetical protein Shyd_85000 [Streptomyces hydrogenans]